MAPMTGNRSALMTPLSPLPVADDDVVAADLDVRLCTPSIVVVSASLELESPDGGGFDHLDLALVIPRSQCRGERPRLAALLDAARAAVARATRAGTSPLTRLPRRVVTLVAGQPHLIPVL